MTAQSETVSTTISSRGEWQWAWLAVFLMNLPLPLLFGFAVTSSGGGYGMLVGVGAVWLIGHVAVARFHFQRGAIVFGGAFLAVSQLLPLLQIAAGMAAMTVAAFNPHRSFANELAFAVTLLTAAQLAVAALGLGRVLRWLASWQGTERRVSKG